MHFFSKMKPIQEIGYGLMHLFFPQVCAGCGTDISGAGTTLCFSCLHRLPLTRFGNWEGNPVEKSFWGRIPVEQATSLCHFTPGSLIQQLLHGLKYKGDRDTGLFLGGMMGRSLQSSGRFETLEALVPLPLFSARERRRGYNQATVLCEGIAAATGLPVLDRAVRRVTATDSQTHKNRIERWLNMEGRFELTNPAEVQSKHLLLVDDVITTGATLEACGRSLLSAAGVRLSIATLAYTLR